MAGVVDHCTGWFEGWWAELCCKPHDLDYAAQVGRAIADSRLFHCVASSLPDIATIHPMFTAVCSVISTAIGALMFVGVRVFGARFYDKAGRK